MSKISVAKRSSFISISDASVSKSKHFAKERGEIHVKKRERRERKRKKENQAEEARDERNESQNRRK